MLCGLGFVAHPSPRYNAAVIILKEQPIQSSNSNPERYTRSKREVQ